MTLTRTPKAVLDPVNSTDTPLAGDAVFTGEWRDITAMAGVAILVSADVAGTASIEWSDDGGTTVHYTDTQTVAAGVPSWEAYPQRGEHYRVRYTNGAAVQTTFHLGAWQQPTDLVAAGGGDTATETTLATLPTSPLISPDGDGSGSGGNSITSGTTLAPAATWTGAWEEVVDYAAISITGSATQSSATNGAAAQFSADGVTILKQTKVSILGTAVGGQAVSFALHPEARYFRLVYTNGGTSSDVVLQTTFRKTANTPGVLPIAATVTSWNLSQLVRAVLTAQKPDGSYTSVTQDVNGNLDVNISAADSEVPITSLTTGSVAQATVGTSVVQIADPPLANRRSLSIKSLSGNTNAIYIGFTTGVNTGSGFPLDAGESMDLEINGDINVYAIAAGAGQRLAWMELGT